MNTKPIEEAKNPGLRGSFAALRRAGERAREVAAATGTLLVFAQNGKVEYHYPHPVRAVPLHVDEPASGDQNSNGKK